MAKHKEILVSVDDFETRVAILEDRQLVEFYIEAAGSRRTAGNIYMGRVKDILPGMEASFVDIGLERNAFLYVNEGVDEVSERESPPHEIEKLLRPGQDVLVQVQKEPVGNKGARLTTHLALAGRKSVFMPYSDFAGVSKRIEGEERERLQAIAEDVCPQEMGIIIRTAAVGATRDEVADDVRFLSDLWEKIQKKAAAAEPRDLIHADLDLSGRVVRDIFGPDYGQVIVDDEETMKELQSMTKKMSPQLAERIRLYRGKLPLFNKHNVESQLEMALKRRVWLRSGGYIAIDKTEALFAIDVNTAKYTGGRNLEQTIYKTNLEAADEIARQLRLRDIGGIIVIDFIDMQEPAHREALFDAFNRALEQDRTKSRVIELSRLGLVEMTRKSLSEGVKMHFYESCSVCGSGKVISTKRAAIEAYRKMKHAATTRAANSFVFKVSPDVCEWLEREALLDKLMALTQKRIRIQAASGMERGEASVVKEGSAAQVEKFLHGQGMKV